MEHTYNSMGNTDKASGKCVLPACSGPWLSSFVFACGLETWRRSCACAINAWYAHVADIHNECARTLFEMSVRSVFYASYWVVWKKQKQKYAQGLETTTAFVYILTHSYHRRYTLQVYHLEHSSEWLYTEQSRVISRQKCTPHDNIPPQQQTHIQTFDHVASE